LNRLGLSNKSKFEPRRRKERKGIKENDKKNPFIFLLCALRAFAVRLFDSPTLTEGEW